MHKMKYPSNFPDKVLYNKMHLSGPLLVREIAEGIRNHYSQLTTEEHWRIATNVAGSMIYPNSDGTHKIYHSFDTFIEEGIKKAIDPKSDLEKLLSEPVVNKDNLGEQKALVA